MNAQRVAAGGSRISIVSRDRPRSGRRITAATVLFGIGAGVAAGLLVPGGEAWLLALGLLGVGFIVLTAHRPEFAAAAMIVLMPLLWRVSIVSVPGVPDLTAGRLLVSWALLVVGWGALRRRDEIGDVTPTDAGARLVRGPLSAWIALFLAFMLLAAVRSPTLSGGLQGLLDEYLLPFVVFLVFVRFPWSLKGVDFVVGAYLVGSCLWAAGALFEFVTKQSLFAEGGVLNWASRSDPFGRTGGPFVNPAFLGTAMGVGLVLGLVWLGRHGAPRRLALVALPFCAIGLVVSLTRASWLAAAAGVVVTLGLRQRGRATAVALAAVATALAAIGLVSLLGAGVVESRATSSSEVYNRIAVQDAAVRVIADHPLLGIGSDRFEPIARQYLRNVGGVSASYGSGVAVPHNSVLDAAVEGGILAGATLVVVFALILVAARALLRQPAHRALGVAVIGSVTVFAVNAMFIDMSLGPTVSTLLFTVLAVALSRTAASAGEES